MIRVVVSGGPGGAWTIEKAVWHVPKWPDISKTKAGKVGGQCLTVVMMADHPYDGVSVEALHLNSLGTLGKSAP